jgi:hypothetical protein
MMLRACRSKRIASLMVTCAILCACASGRARTSSTPSLADVETMLPPLEGAIPVTEQIARQALAENLAIGNPWGVVTDLHNLADIYSGRGMVSEIPRRLLDKALAISRAHDYRLGVLRSLAHLAQAHERVRDHTASLAYSEELIATIDQRTDPDEVAYKVTTLRDMAYSEALRRRFGRSASLFQDALRLSDNISRTSMDENQIRWLKQDLLGELTTVYLGTGRYDEVVTAITQARRSSPDVEFSTHRRSINKTLAEAVQALEERGRLHEVSDTIDQLLADATARNEPDIDDLRVLQARVNRALRR